MISTHMKAIIFDLGKVIIDISFDRTREYWADASGLTFADVKERFLLDEVHDRFERNQISEAEFRDHVREQLGVSLSDEIINAGWNDLLLNIYDGVEELLSTLSKEYRLVILSNTNIIHERAWMQSAASALQYFEKIFCSNHIGARKPEPAAYQAVLDYLALPASETLFLDDRIENIEAARKMGIHAIQVFSTAQMKEDIRQYIS